MGSCVGWLIYALSSCFHRDLTYSAYHDMATHNIEDGTGGIDSSIGWETDRSENIGTAMNTTLQFFLPFTNKFISSK
jgi:hypothetical protein